MGVVLFQVQQIVPRGAGPQVSLFALSPEVRVTHHYFLEKRERQREPRLGAGRSGPAGILQGQNPGPPLTAWCDSGQVMVPEPESVLVCNSVSAF